MTSPDHARDAVLTVLRDLLDDEAVTEDDDFYLVGGHSLLILSVVKRLEREHGLSIDMRAFGIDSRIDALIASCRSLDRGSP